MIRDGFGMLRIALILLLLASTPVLADIQAGVNALGRGNYPKALEIFQPLAESGDWNAQGFLAHTYKLMENHREAYAWYYSTAKCGSKDAQIELYLLEPKLSPKIIEQGKALGESYYDLYCR
jgi:TPR repeat protein